MPQSTATRVNDFTIKIATVNGTGSASANTLLMKSIFRSGIPVMGKNYFPSNIQGLPTWYEIRVTRDGYVARSGQVDIMVAMNAETYARDVREVAPGGYLVYDYARGALACPLPLRAEKMANTAGHIMIDGNTAAALGCVFAGATVAAWYPITPSTSLMDAFKMFSDRMRVDPASGRKNFAFI